MEHVHLLSEKSHENGKHQRKRTSSEARDSTLSRLHEAREKVSQSGCQAAGQSVLSRSLESEPIYASQSLRFTCHSTPACATNPRHLSFRIPKATALERKVSDRIHTVSFC